MKRVSILFCGCLIAAAFALQAQVTIHVPADFPTIQAAIVAADPGDIVLVSNGIYEEQINFLGKAITVASEYLITGDHADIDNTIIDGASIQYPNPDSCSLVYFINDEDTTSVLCGFTIQHGKGTYHTYANETFNAGGAIFIHTAGAKIIYNHITENHLSDTFPGNPKYVDAAAIAIYGNTDKWVVVDHNQIDHNSCYASQADAARVAGIWVYDHNCLITNNNISSDTCLTEGNSSALAGAFVCYSPLVNVYSAIIQSNVFRYNLVQSSDYAAAACGATQNYIIKFSGNLVEYNQSFGQTTAYWDGGTFELIDPGPGSFVKDNTFHGNTTYRLGGACNMMLLIEQPDHEPVLVENNYFLANESSNGGAFHSRNVPVILQNNVFSGNYSSGHGGAILVQENMPTDNPHLLTSINNSFFGNHCDFSGGAIYTTQVDPLVINSIFWNDSSSSGSNEIYVGTFNSVEIANCDIDLNGVVGELIDGGGNINEDPVFTDPELLKLDHTSPCIDGGINSFTCACGVTNFCPSYDIMGVPRPQSGEFEMGAYELLFEAIQSPGKQQLETSIFPNPFNNYTTINYTLEKNAIVKITVLNEFGQVVSETVNGRQQDGEHQVIINADNLPAGIYFWRLTIDNQQSVSGKMIRM